MKRGTSDIEVVSTALLGKSYHRPKTRGELRDMLKKGVSCEVAWQVSNLTEIMLRGWLQFEDFTVMYSENSGWALFVPNKLIDESDR